MGWFQVFLNSQRSPGALTAKGVRCRKREKRRREDRSNTGGFWISKSQADGFQLWTHRQFRPAEESGWMRTQGETQRHQSVNLTSCLSHDPIAFIYLSLNTIRSLNIVTYTDISTHPTHLGIESISTFDVCVFQYLQLFKEVNKESIRGGTRSTREYNSEEKGKIFKSKQIDSPVSFL